MEERFEVIKALLELDCIPCGMEYFPAASEDSWTYISSLIEQCDYYICIVGGRYGSQTPEGVSFTQKEYEFAILKGVPTIAFIHGKPDDLPTKKSEFNELNRQKLVHFIATLRKHLCKNWTTPHELGAVVSRSLTQLIKRSPRIGWIPANQGQDPQRVQELLDLTKKVQELDPVIRELRGRQIANVEELADGEDQINIDGVFEVYQKNKPREYPNEVFECYVAATVSPSWNDLFRIIAPRITPVASDASNRNAVSSALENKANREAYSLKKGQWFKKFTISDESWNIVRTQFVALGFLTIAKESGVKQSSIVWRLTEIGEQKMFALLAQRKSSHSVGRTKPHA